MQETEKMWGQYMGQEDSLKEEMASHSSILVWKIPWTEEPGGLLSRGVTKSQTRLSDWGCHIQNTKTMAFGPIISWENK